MNTFDSTNSNTHQAKGEVGEFSLHFPMAITPRYQPQRAVNVARDILSEAGEYLPIPEVSQNDDSLPDLTFQTKVSNQTIDLSVNLFAGAVLDQVNSINHSLISTQKDHGHYALKLMNQPMDKDFKLTWQYQHQDLPQVLNFQQTYKDKQYGLLMVLPGELGLNQSKVAPLRELTFILDTSGSMAGNSLAQAKQAFKYALTSLNERDSFQLIAFNSYPTQLFKTPVLANDKNKQHAWRFVSGLESTGGTEIKSALDLVLKDKSNSRVGKNEKLQQIVFLTDGAVGNEADIFLDIANNIGSKRLFTVGLGTAPNRYFMKKSAEIGRGSYQFISNHSELVKEMNHLFTKLSQPVLTDLNMSLVNGSANVKGAISPQLNTTPNPIPDVYAGEPLFLSYQFAGANTKEDQVDSLLTGVYQGNAWSVSIENNSIESPSLEKDSEQLQAYGIGRQTLLSIVAHKTEQDIPPLATLWARRKIADHYRQLMLNKDVEAKSKIIGLALEYNLVTPFTSLVAVEKEASRSHNETADAKQLTNTLPAGQKLPSTALNWQWQFNAAICLLLMSLISLLLLPARVSKANK